LIAFFAIALVWATNVFEIITLASHAFSAYYLIQTLVSLLVSQRLPVCATRCICQISFTGIALFLFAIVIFSIPVE